VGVEDVEDEVEGLRDFLGGDVEWGEEADGFGAGGWDEESFGEEFGTEVDGGNFAFGESEGGWLDADAEEEAVAPDLGDGGVVPVGDGFPDLGFAGFDVFGEVFRDDSVDDGFGGGASEGVATVGGAVAAGAEEWGVFLGNPEGADGEAPAHAFGPRDAIGDETGGDGIVAVEVAGSAEAALDFVEEKKEVFFLSESGEAFEKFLGHGIHSAFALDGFEEEGDGFIGEGGLDGFEVVWLDVDEAWEEGIEAFVDLGLRRGGHGPDGAPVKGFVEGHDFVATALETEPPRELDEAVVGLGPGVREEDFAGVLDHFFDDEFGEVGLGLDVVEIRAVHQGGCLLRDGPGEGGWAVAERAGRDAGAEIEILATVLIPHFGALAASHGEGESAVGLENVLLCLFGGGHHFVFWGVSFLGLVLEVRGSIIKVAIMVKAAPQSSMRPNVASKKSPAPLPAAKARTARVFTVKEMMERSIKKMPRGSEMEVMAGLGGEGPSATFQRGRRNEEASHLRAPPVGCFKNESSCERQAKPEGCSSEEIGLNF